MLEYRKGSRPSFLMQQEPSVEPTERHPLRWLLVLTTWLLWMTWGLAFLYGLVQVAKWIFLVP